ncbi:MAG: isoprenylcysteine carboxylmethyltransferase family protein [Deltaproteobacteria bacterium]|nr:isoprenylcysteine carboxylmethyltransferase family protein [Deltaproteobacteria bacterium]MBW2415365.1 isoprenylcysteine carboxylmethyltransferase family protein [Deltaproteobacteria bacterium]
MSLISRKRLKPRLLLVYVAAAVALWASQPTPLTMLAGLLPLAIGEGLRIWATGYLHKSESLTVAGPYAYLRHPLYAGTLLIAAGFSIMAGTQAAAIVLTLFLLTYFAYYMPYKNRIEGARLEELFGDAFRRYAVAVPRLVPRLHAYTPLGGDASGSVVWRSERFTDNNEIGTAVVVGLGVLAMAARGLLS